MNGPKSLAARAKVYSKENTGEINQHFSISGHCHENKENWVLFSVLGRKVRLIGPQKCFNKAIKKLYAAANWWTCILTHARKGHGRRIRERRKNKIIDTNCWHGKNLLLRGNIWCLTRRPVYTQGTSSDSNEQWGTERLTGWNATIGWETERRACTPHRVSIATAVPRESVP